MRCVNCNKSVVIDQEDNLIHKCYENKGVDARMCNPNNPDSKIAE